jgi:hypothetical protein
LRGLVASVFEEKMRAEGRSEVNNCDIERCFRIGFVVGILLEFPFVEGGPMLEGDEGSIEGVCGDVDVANGRGGGGYSGGG